MTDRDLRDVPYWKLSHEERMERRRQRRESDPEFQARLEARMQALAEKARARRLSEIWGAIREHDRAEAERRRQPIALRIKATPRVRGVGSAARRAGF